MEILIIDSDPAARAVLMGRIQELKRGRDLQTIEPVPLLPKGVSSRTFATVGAVILGPGLADSFLPVLEALATKPSCPVASMFPSGAQHVVTIPSDDDEALKLFLIQSIARSQLAKLAEARRVIGVAQLAGGVGASTLALQLGRAFAATGLNTTVFDLDDVGTTVSTVSKAAPRYRAAVSDALLRGTVDEGSVAELLSPLAQNLTIIPQPESYAEAFHFKANVLETAPVASVTVNGIISSLRARDHTVIIDLGRSWGLGTFAALPRCGQILFVLSARPLERVKASLEALRRLQRESDGTDEFDTSRWSLVVTGTNSHHAPEVRRIVAASTIFPESVSVTFLPEPESDEFGSEIGLLAERLG